MQNADPSANINDSDYVFITFILDYLPHGLIGLLVACFFFATLGSKSGELNALATCSIIDFYRYIIHPPRSTGVPPVSPPANTNVIEPETPAAPEHGRDAHATSPEERHYVRASRFFTLFWGIISLCFALFVFPHFAENLIQATNIVGSIFYGGILGLFLIAFFLKFIHGTAAFTGALVGQTVVFAFLLPPLNHLNIAYLWYNPIGCLTTIAAATVIQLILGQPPETQQGFPVLAAGRNPAAPPVTTTAPPTQPLAAHPPLS
jgi:Na+/proline symporter